MNIPIWISKAIGKIYITKTPFFIMWNPKLHKLKGHEIRDIQNNLKPGDILLRRYDGYLNTYFTPGYWGHSGLAISENKVIHAIGKGVIKEDILDFCRADSIALLRFKEITDENINRAIQIAEQMVIRKVKYDFQFADKNKNIYCTELINECYGEIFYDCYTFIAGKYILLPDHMQKSELLNTIIEFKH